MKVLITGVKNSNQANLARMLEYYGVTTRLVHYMPKIPLLSRCIRKFNPDVSLIFSIRRWHWLLRCQMLGGLKIYRPQGTDVYRRNKLSKLVLRFLHWRGTPILYASKELRSSVGLSGEVFATPIDTSLFRPLGLERDKDTLYYVRNNNVKLYGQDQLCEYVAQHPNEQISYVTGEIPHTEMNEIYNQHKKYVRFTLHDANPKMPYEAFLAGCESWFNGQQITHIPDFMRMETAIPKLVSYLEYMLFAHREQLRVCLPEQ